MKIWISRQISEDGDKPSAFVRRPLYTMEESGPAMIDLGPAEHLQIDFGEGRSFRIFHWPDKGIAIQGPPATLPIVAIGGNTLYVTSFSGAGERLVMAGGGVRIEATQQGGAG
jgi:hypothetical protein